MNFRNICIIASLLLSILSSCSKDEQNSVDFNRLDAISIPRSFPDMIFPIGNEFTSDRWELGKKLFYDKRLSIDESISCGNCHLQSLGFADDLSLTPGVFGREAVRNVPSLTNIGYHPYYTREGGVPTLEMQVLVPISEHNEFGFNLVEIVNRLQSDAQYQDMSKQAYGRSLDAFVITRAIANFERSLISGNSRFDLFEQGESGQLNNQEIKGMSLFFSDKTNCSQCHSGFNFTDYGFKNNGLYTEYGDNGRFRLTQKDEDFALFKTPGLRNVGFTAPYMFDGSLSTLDEVINHYNSGGKNHPQKSQLIRPLNLSESEKSALKAFLLTLNDEKFIKNKFFSPN